MGGVAFYPASGRYTRQCLSRRGERLEAGGRRLEELLAAPACGLQPVPPWKQKADAPNKANVRQDKLGKGGRSWIVHERKPFLMPRGFDSLAVKAHHQP